MSEQDLRNEIDRLRATNSRLNRRCQFAECAAADAHRCLLALAKGTEKGTPWCGGSLGRALLAWHNSQLRAVVEAARKVRESLARTDVRMYETGLEEMNRALDDLDRGLNGTNPTPAPPASGAAVGE